MLIGGAFLTLFSAWALWGWAVGESRNIQPLRKICGPVFVICATVLVAGGTIKVTRSAIRRQAESNVRELLTGIHERLENGEAELVQSQLRKLIVNDPDEDPVDLMASLPDASSCLETENPKTAVAVKMPDPDDHYRR